MIGYAEKIFIDVISGNFCCYKIIEQLAIQSIEKV